MVLSVQFVRLGWGSINRAVHRPLVPRGDNCKAMGFSFPAVIKKLDFTWLPCFGVGEKIDLKQQQCYYNALCMLSLCCCYAVGML